MVRKIAGYVAVVMVLVLDGMAMYYIVNRDFQMGMLALIVVILGSMQAERLFSEP